MAILKAPGSWVTARWLQRNTQRPSPWKCCNLTLMLHMGQPVILLQGVIINQIWRPSRMVSFPWIAWEFLGFSITSSQDPRVCVNQESGSPSYPGFLNFSVCKNQHVCSLKLQICAVGESDAKCFPDHTKKYWYELIINLTAPVFGYQWFLNSSAHQNHLGRFLKIPMPELTQVN